MISPVLPGGGSYLLEQVSATQWVTAKFKKGIEKSYAIQPEHMAILQEAVQKPLHHVLLNPSQEFQQ